MRNWWWFRSRFISAHSFAFWCFAEVQRTPLCANDAELCVCVCVWKRAYRCCDLFVFALALTRSFLPCNAWSEQLTSDELQFAKIRWLIDSSNLQMNIDRNKSIRWDWLIDNFSRVSSVRLFFFASRSLFNLFASFHYGSCCHAPLWFWFGVFSSFVRSLSLSLYIAPYRDMLRVSPSDH